MPPIPAADPTSPLERGRLAWNTYLTMKSQDYRGLAELRRQVRTSPYFKQAAGW